MAGKCMALPAVPKSVGIQRHHRSEDVSTPKLQHEERVHQTSDCIEPDVSCTARKSSLRRRAFEWILLLAMATFRRIRINRLLSPSARRPAYRGIVSQERQCATQTVDEEQWGPCPRRIWCKSIAPSLPLFSIFGINVKKAAWPRGHRLSESPAAWQIDRMPSLLAPPRPSPSDALGGLLHPERHRRYRTCLILCESQTRPSWPAHLARSADRREEIFRPRPLCRALLLNEPTRQVSPCCLLSRSMGRNTLHAPERRAVTPPVEESPWSSRFRASRNVYRHPARRAAAGCETQ